MLTKTETVAQDELMGTLDTINTNHRFKLLDVKYDSKRGKYKVTYTWQVPLELLQLGRYILTNPVLAYEGFSSEHKVGDVIPVTYWQDHPIGFLKMLRKMTHMSLGNANDVKRVLWDEFGYTLPESE